MSATSKCIAALLALTFACMTSVAFAQDQPSLDDLLNLTPPPPTDNANTPPDDTTDNTDASPEPDNPELGDALNAEQTKALIEQIGEELINVAERLRDAKDPHVDTQRMQEAITRKLDQLIAEAKKQQQGGQGSPSGGQPQQQQTGSEQNQSQSQAQAGNANQPAGTGENPGNFSPGSTGSDAAGGLIEEHRSEWGSLPPRLRDELIQGMEERFSPVYRQLTEKYFQRLAEDRP